MSIANVKKNIKSIFERKKMALYGLSLDYAAMALKYFQSVQSSEPNTPGKFWHNRTGTAAARMFSGAEITKKYISWYMSHFVQYGEYLETSNNRRHEAIWPIIKRYVGRYYNDAKKVYSDN